MQRGTTILFIFFFLLTFGATISEAKNTVSSQLHKADSLFESKKFTQSLNEYKTLYYTHNAFTVRSLTRMAFLCERMNKTEESLIYLSKLETITHSPILQEKISALAEKNQLAGYDFSDVSKIIHLYTEYKNTILSITLAVLAFIVVGMYFSSTQVRYGLMVVFFVGLAFTQFVLWYQPTSTHVITIGKPIFLMNGASAGADVITQLPSGTKAVLVAEESCWYKVVAGDKTGYILKNKGVVI